MNKILLLGTVGVLLRAGEQEETAVWGNKEPQEAFPALDRPETLRILILRFFFFFFFAGFVLGLPFSLD